MGWRLRYRCVFIDMTNTIHLESGEIEDWHSQDTRFSKSREKPHISYKLH